MKKLFNRDEIPDETIILEPHDMDECIVGINNGKLTYDYNMLIEYFVKSDGMDYMESIEWIEFNIGCLHTVDIVYPPRV